MTLKAKTKTQHWNRRKNVNLKEIDHEDSWLLMAMYTYSLTISSAQTFSLKGKTTFRLCNYVHPSVVLIQFLFCNCDFEINVTRLSFYPTETIPSSKVCCSLRSLLLPRLSLMNTHPKAHTICHGMPARQNFRFHKNCNFCNLCGMKFGDQVAKTGLEQLFWNWNKESCFAGNFRAFTAKSTSAEVEKKSLHVLVKLLCGQKNLGLAMVLRKLQDSLGTSTVSHLGCST